MTSAPAWFTNALANRPRSHQVTVDDASINWLSWGDVGKPGLIFVHGGAAHAHWWSHIAPMFAAEHRVAAIDLSGHGDSDWRTTYTLDGWCDEVAAVIEGAGFDGPPIMVGHSMGGFVTVATAARHSEMLAGAIIIDSPIMVEDAEVVQARSTDQFKRPKTYEDPSEAWARFRTVPEQAVYLPWVRDNIARHSLRLDPADNRWHWKFDAGIFVPKRHEAAALLGQVRCRMGLLRCENGLVTPDIGEYMYDKLGRVAPVIELPTAGHHPMLDVPLILITAIRSLLADWDHSIPFRRRER